MKKLLSTLALSFLLIGCTNDKSNEVHTEESSEQEVVEEKAEVKTREQYLSDFEASVVYQKRTQDVEVTFTEVIDFEGDEVPEIVLGTNDGVTECNVTIYELENDEWVGTPFTYHSNLAIYVESIGRLTYEDGTLKEAVAFSRTEAQASSMSQSFSILHYNGETNKIEELIKMPLQSSDLLSESLDANTITVTSKDGSILNYIFKNGEILDSDGNRMGIIIDEDLAKLVGTTINNYYMGLEDSYYVAKEKITEPLINEDYFEGGLCSFYETFFICDYEREGGGLHAYYISPANEVTVDDLSSFFNQTLEVNEWEAMMSGGYSYTTEIMTESGMYNLEFDGDDPEALLEFISYIPN